MTIQIQRIYEKPLKEGVRVLVDRVWPRGISKDQANLDHWLKNIAPTAELRKWFNHDPQLYAAFKEKYEKELRENEEQQEAFNELQDIIANSKQDVILLYGAKDEQHNQAIVLQQLLQ
ncbi:DUF488 domain-containing protein [Staphylococcus cohnii]|uniref:DUF488 domain-containing protein n=1 Tax=Staphylococcus cohnii species complex TaxID=3239053 RepID=UPI000D19F750|nr:DUF488 family protein [Staphylococcus ureilyticus]PTF46583.1 DUF488 domain-containing protein [Staphylococcus cohnii]MBM9448295.1 DUF488 family protein [Staphylococcus ureilyticus]PTG43003.1 DUF488 domain-containing protein [Staphylococcus cohnii]PUZ35054.1 DUF488 domain-containing protein [Staphylococcus cohnii]HJG67334.1 DUF488 family protein [Staphylococcus ureilyticus]